MSCNAPTLFRLRLTVRAKRLVPLAFGNPKIRVF